MTPTIIAKHTTYQLAKNLINSGINWAKNGFPIVDDETIKMRQDICKQCINWDPQAFANTGKCKLCGCATKFKLKLKTERCPDKKW